ncbi:MAG: HAD-IA family hydrolase [Candidatus Sumerlaeota bacterium]|nr:HAD-IA family hydrolase [Candidatus Sumerlaeota bacterium]
MSAVPLAEIRLVVLDLDGTLVDAFEDIHQATNYTLAQLGKAPLDFATVRSFVGNGAVMLLRRALRIDDGDLIARALAHWQAYAAEHAAERSRLYPGALEFLDGVRRLGVKTALLSNKPHAITVEILARLGLAERFDLAWGERPEFPCKPDPGALRAVMERLGARSDQTLVVGDGAPDLEVAKAAGAFSCGAAWGLTSREGLIALGADVTVDNIDELLRDFESAHSPTSAPGRRADAGS